MTNSVRRLAELFVPAHYDITLNLVDRAKRTYTGTVTLTGALKTASSAIILHAKELAITSATVDDLPVTTKSGDYDELIISADQQLAAGDHVIHLVFSGTITDPMSGVYPCYFEHGNEQKELLMTQFESHAAREAFPCLDEPAAKATFALTLTTEPGITVLSNTPVASQQQNDGALVTQFEQTPKMSTYLLAFVLGDLVSHEAKSAHGVTVRAFATPNHANELAFAAEHCAKVLDFYDDYFAIPYPLPKCDLVACPDFAAGAMENWGLMTFREAALLVDKNDTPAENIQRVAEVIGHELAHQWFGDLVTMQWWDDLWLNESFANWMESYSTAHFYPEWQIWEQYSATEQQSALMRDSLATVQAVQQHVNHPDEIATLFDPAIVYAKGGSLIRMLNEYIGEKTFRNGLRIYMQRHKYSNTTTQDLWNALSEASGKDIGAFMNAWITKPGHPIITCNAKGDELTLHQQRFYANPNNADPNDASLWPAPILCDSLPDADILAIKQKTFTAKAAPYHLINKGGTGFYHTKYDAATMQAIAAAVSDGKLSVTDRQRLLMDAYALNRAGAVPTVQTLQLLDHYTNEANYAVWLGMNAALNAARILVNEDAHLKPHVRRFVADVSRSQYERLGWDLISGESHFDALLRPFALANMAYSRDPEVEQKCVELFNAAKQPEDLLSDTRSIIYSVAVRKNEAPAVKKLLNWYATTQSADERINICAGLSNARDPQQIQELLALITSKTVKLQDAYYWFVYFFRSHHARQAAWQWMQDNWQWIRKNFEGEHEYDYFPRTTGSIFSTPQELAQYKAFFMPKLSEPALKRVITQGIEDIETKMLWRERDLAAIADYLKQRD